MKNNKLILIAFILVALAQLYVPAKMILGREDILSTGKEYKFKTAPIDPGDPFRGKYIILRFDENTIEIQDEAEWEEGETIYVFLSEDNNGFVKISSVSKEEPPASQDFLKAKAGNVFGNGSKKLVIDYPFDRYYMEESKAYEAELTYQRSQADTNQVAYALVSIKEGEAVLKDVLIDGVPIREVVMKERENQK